jgi:hypothetical protein
MGLGSLDTKWTPTFKTRLSAGWIGLKRMAPRTGRLQQAVKDFSPDDRGRRIPPRTNNEKPQRGLGVVGNQLLGDCLRAAAALRAVNTKPLALAVRSSDRKLPAAAL